MTNNMQLKFFYDMCVSHYYQNSIILTILLKFTKICFMFLIMIIYVTFISKKYKVYIKRNLKLYYLLRVAVHLLTRS